MQERLLLGEQAGLLWTWWRDDTLSILPPLRNFTVEEAGDYETLASLMEVSTTEIATHLQDGQRPYLARLDNVPAAFGWSASGKASFGEGRVRFHLPVGQRYLYNFVTLPTWRGLGIYPRLLQAILLKERGEVERFWINHHVSNQASEKGIRKASFQIAGKVYFLTDDKLCLVTPSTRNERARAGAELLDIPLLEVQY